MRSETVALDRWERLTQRLAPVRGCIERAYSDQLDGKITEEFWEARPEDWSREEQQRPERILVRMRTLELANKAYFLRLRPPPFEHAKLPRIVVSNYKVDATTLDPTCRKPFDLILDRGKKEGSRVQRFESCTNEPEPSHVGKKFGDNDDGGASGLSNCFDSFSDQPDPGSMHFVRCPFPDVAKIEALSAGRFSIGREQEQECG